MPSALSAFPATTPHIHSVTTCTASPCQHTSTAHSHHTRLLNVSNDHNEGAYVHPRSSDVSDTSLPNAGASVAMPSSPSSLSAATPHRQRYNAQYNALPMQLHCTHHHTRLQYAPRPQRTKHTYSPRSAMSATPACLTPAPVPPCPLRQTCFLQPHRTDTA